jgi:L-iditol 2-dehydrogenase
MRACVYEGESKITVKEVQKPSLPKGGAIVKVIVASICGTDLRTYRFGSDNLSVPRIIGHEACCIIEELDEGIKDFKVGDRVMVAPALGCGECKSCLRGNTNMCDDLKTIGFQFEGTFAEYCAIPRQAFKMKNVIKIPDNISDEEVSVVEPVACALNAQSFLNISKGDNVLIYGAGYLGCIHAELALIKGANKVMLAEISKERRDQAEKDVEGIHVLNSGADDFIDKVKGLTGRDGVDVVITACPAGITHKQALELVYKNGRISLFGGLAGNASGFLDSNLIHYKEVGVFGAHASTPKQNKEALELVTSKTLNVKKYISSYPLEKITDAFKSLVNETSVKAVIKP